MSRNDRVEIGIDLESRGAERKLVAFDAGMKALIATEEKTTEATKKVGDAIATAGDKTEEAEKKSRSMREGLNALSDRYTDLRAKILDVASAASGIVDLAAANDKHERAIRALGPAYAAVRAATSDTVSAGQALLAQQSLTQAGLRITTSELAVVTRAARDQALALGIETPEALGQLTEALRSGSSEGFGRFGLTVDATHGRLRAASDAIQQLEERQRSGTVAARTMGEETQLLSRQMNELGGEIAGGLISSLTSLYQWYSKLHGVQGGFLAQAREVGSWIANQQGRADREQGEAWNQRQDRRLRTREGLTAYARTHGISLNTENRSDAELDALQEAAQRRGGSARDVESLNRAQQQGVEEGRARRGFDAETQRMLDAANAARDTSVRTNRVSIGGGGSTSPAQTAIAAYRRTVSEAMLTGATISPVGIAPRGADAAAWWNERTARQQEVNALARFGLTEGSAQQLEDDAADRDSQRANDIVAMQGASDRGEAVRADRFARQSGARAFAQTAASKAASERRGSFGGMALEAAGTAMNDDGTVKTFDLMNDSAKMLGGTIGMLKTSVGELFSTLASGTLSAGEAFAQFGIKMLKSLGDVFINQGVGFVFQGIAALATGNPGGAVTIGAGTGMIALGAGMGGIAAVATPGASSGGAANVASSKSASGRTSGGRDTGGGNTTIVISSLVPPGPQELQGLVRASRQAGRYGMTAPSPRQVRI